MRNKRVLITGSRGLLGSTLKIILENAGYHVLEFEGDIRDRAIIKSYTQKKLNLDWIIHSAAMVDVDRCEKNQEECFEVNVDGTRIIRDLAVSLTVPLLYISTSSVFSGKEGNYKEGDVPYPTNFYNLTKLLGEHLVLEYDKGHVVRLNIIGLHPRGSRGKNFMEWLFDSIVADKNLTLFTDSHINPLSNWTTAEMIKKIIEIEPKDRMFHIGSQNTLSKAAVGQHVASYFPQYRGTITLTSSGSVLEVPRPAQMWLNIDYVGREYNINMPTLESELEMIVIKYRESFT